MSLESQIIALAQRVATEFNSVKASINVLNTSAYSGTTYTPSLSDNGNLITFSNGAAITVTVPADSTTNFPMGSQIRLLQLGVGQVTVTPSQGVSVYSADGLRLASQYSGAELIKTGNNTWVLIGRTMI